MLVDTFPSFRFIFYFSYRESDTVVLPAFLRGSAAERTTNRMRRHVCSEMVSSLAYDQAVSHQHILDWRTCGRIEIVMSSYPARPRHFCSQMLKAILFLSARDGQGREQKSLASPIESIGESERRST